jgi:hypothetical protein
MQSSGIGLVDSENCGLVDMTDRLGGLTPTGFPTFQTSDFPVALRE